MAGLRMICKIYGGMTVTGADGNTVEYWWDYQQDKPRPKEEMLAEAKAAKERRKRKKIIDQTPDLFNE